jgi:hypothetical protein
MFRDITDVSLKLNIQVQFPNCGVARTFNHGCLIQIKYRNTNCRSKILVTESVNHQVLSSTYLFVQQKSIPCTPPVKPI